MTPAESLDPTTEDDLVAGIAQLRTSAVWIIGAYAVVGAALIGGLQFTKLGQADPQWLAWAGAGVAVGGVTAAILAAAAVLRPEAILPIDVVSDPRLVAAVQRDVTLLEGRSPPLKSLHADLVTAYEHARKAWDAAEAHTAGTPAHMAARRADDDLDELLELLRRLGGFSRFLETHERFRRARWRIAGGTLAATLGIATLATATSSKPADSSNDRPREVRVAMTVGGIAQFEGTIGRGCVRGVFPAVRLDSGVLALPADVVVLPGRGCRTARLHLTLDTARLLPF